MAVGIVDRQKLVNIADAVRAKKGITGNMTLDDIASNITSMPTADNNAKFDFAGSGSKSSGDLKEYLTSIDLSGFDTSNYTDMNHLFQNCNSITSLDVSNFNTGKVTDMSYMFFYCSSLKTLDLSSFNTSKVNSFYSFTRMFSGCSSLKALDLSNFDFSNTYAYENSGLTGLFYYCKSLETITFPSTVTFNNLGVSFNEMFQKCSSLTSLDLSGFDTSKVAYMKDMFTECSKLSNLTLGENWASNSSISSFDLSSCPLTRESAVDVINKLATRSNSPVIKFSDNVGLYQSEIDIATNKGWSVSGCSVLVEDPSTATVGQYALIDGEMSKCVYVADEPQAWGQRIFTTYSSFKNSNGVYKFEWGGYGTETGIRNYEIGNGLSNTNALIAMNLQSSDGTPTVWDAITEFRSTHSDRWFVPCRDEVAFLKEGDWSDIGGSKWSSSEYENNSNIYVYVSLYESPYFRNASKNLLYYLKPFTYV